jgi:hypothetical protein
MAAADPDWYVDGVAKLDCFDNRGRRLDLALA